MILMLPEYNFNFPETNFQISDISFSVWKTMVPKHVKQKLSTMHPIRIAEAI